MVVDPQGPTTGSDRVIRGGCDWDDWLGWDGSARHCRSAYRDSYDPGCGYDYLGFRVRAGPRSVSQAVKRSCPEQAGGARDDAEPSLRRGSVAGC